MALSLSKYEFYKALFHNGNKYFTPLLGTVTRSIVPVARYSDEPESSTSLNKAMAAYLEKTKKYDEFLKEQLKEYNLGKKHLANMMGVRGKDLTQEEINEAIDYLFPSGLFDRLARPLLKPPEKIFPKQKPAEYDETGRPFHFLYYTTMSNYSQALHDAAKYLDDLNHYEQKMRKIGGGPTQTLSLAGEKWLPKEKVEIKFIEKIFDHHYDRLIEVLERLAAHPYNYLCGEFIKSFRQALPSPAVMKIPKPEVDKDGKLFLKTSGKRKTSESQVTVKYPGDGKIIINNMGLNYFGVIQAREQGFVKEMDKMLFVRVTFHEGPNFPFPLESSVKGLNIQPEV